MKKVSYLLIALLLVIFSCQAWAVTGTTTSNGFLYKPPLGARGAIEKNLFDAGLDRVDARLGKEIWVGDLNYGTTLQSALTAIGTSNNVILRVPAGTHNIAADLTVPANLILKPERGAILSIATGKTLTISNPPDAGDYQIFSCTGTGKVSPSRAMRVNARWWGNVPDGTTDNFIPLQQCLTSMGIYGGTVYVPPATLAYAIDSDVFCDVINNSTLVIEGYGSKFKYLAATTGSHALLTFISSDATGTVKLRGFEVDGNRAATGSSYYIYGIHLGYLGGITHAEAEDLYIHDCRGHGIYELGNWAAVRNCRFKNNYLNAIDANGYGLYQEISGCTFEDSGCLAIDCSRPTGDLKSPYEMIITNNRFKNWGLSNTGGSAITVAGLPNNGEYWPYDNKGHVVVTGNVAECDTFAGNTYNLSGINVSCDNAIISNNTIKGYFDYAGTTNFTGISYGAETGQNVSIISNNVDTCAYGINNANFAGDWRSMGGVRIEGNNITNCSAYGIDYVGYNGTTAPVSSYLTRNIKIKNNTIRMMHQTVCDYYDDTLLDNYIALNDTISGVGQSFTGNGQELTSVRFWLKRTDAGDALTGNVTAKLYAHSGTFGTSSVPTGAALISSTTITVTDIPTYAYLPIDFLFNISSQTLTGATHYVVTIEYAGGSATHYLMVGCDASSPAHGGNSCAYAGSWSAAASKDVCFAVFTPSVQNAIYAKWVHDSEIADNEVNSGIEVATFYNTKVNNNTILKSDYGDRGIMLNVGDALSTCDHNKIVLPSGYGNSAKFYGYLGTFNFNKVSGGYNVPSYPSIYLYADSGNNISQGMKNLSLDNGFEFQVNGVSVTDFLTACAGGSFPANAWHWWDWGTGWSQGGVNQMVAASASTAISQNAGSTPPNQPIVAGRLYILKYTMTRTGGTLTPAIGATAGTARSASGTYTETLRATGTTALTFTGSGFSGTLSSVSLYPVDF